MTPDERSLLQAFLSDLAQTPNVAKDPEAEAMIQDAVRANPNALYLLVQHAILSDQALHAAQSQRAPSFLPPAPQNDYRQDDYRQDNYPQNSPQGGYGQGGAPWAGPGGSPVPSSPFAANSGLGGFLRSAGTMAAGVAAGDFLAQGIENIFSPRW